MADEVPPVAGDAAANAGATDMTFVYGVPVTLQVYFGDATVTIGDILKCGKGSVIPLNQKVGDPFTVLLQNRPIAQGEIVEAGETLGIKIINVLTAAEREAKMAVTEPTDPPPA